MSRSGWRLTGLGWWLSAVLILLARQINHPADHVAWIEPPHAGSITTDPAWDSPLSRLPVIQEASRVPAWLACAVLAGLIAWLAVTASRHMRPLLVCVVVLGLSPGARPEQFVLLTVTAVAARHAAAFSSTSRPIGWGLAAVTLGMAAGLSTVDFGVVVLLLLTGVIAESASVLSRPRHAEWKKLTVAAGLMLTIGVCCVIFGSPFRRALLRPLLAIQLGWQHSLFPRLATPLTDIGHWPAVACLLVMVAIVVLRFRRHGTAHVSALSLAFAAMLLTFGSRLWLGAGMTALASLGGSPLGRGIRQSHRRAEHVTAQLVPLGVGAAMLMLTTMSHGIGFWLSGFPQRQVDLSSWSVSGNALLTDRDLAERWKGPLAPPRASLLMDDRFDVQPGLALEYAAACFDVRAGRNERYRRVDGSWGGYAPFFETWSPTLIVVNSTDALAIRQLSLDPAWNVMAIDTELVVFGKAGDPTIAAQARNAGNLLFQLEWPRPQARVTLDGTLEFGTDADRRRVASVLNAVRLPYAALRVLPRDTTDATQSVRAWAWTELALRCLRQTGRRSLVDQYRAVRALRSLQQNIGWSGGTENARIAANLASLRDASTETRLQINDEEAGVVEAMSVAERQVRDHLLNGDRSAVVAALPELKPRSIRDFYAAIAELAAAPGGRGSDLLFSFSQVEELPQRLQEEFFFACGCLALERTDAAGAVDYLRKSRKVRPNSAFSELRNLYLVQLGFHE